MATIETLEGLAEHLGTSDAGIECISRAAHRATTSGAFVEFIPPGLAKTGRKDARVTVLGMPSLNGWTVHAIRVDGRPVFDIGNRYSGTDGGTPLVDRRVPQEILDYLEAKPEVLPASGQKVYTCSQESSRNIEQAMQSDAPGLVVDRYRTWERLSFRISIDILKEHRGGVRVGPITEGTDAAPCPYDLLFPFSTTRFDAVLAGAGR